MLSVLSVAIEAGSPGVARAARSLEKQGFSPTLRLKLNNGVVEGWAMVPANASATGANSQVVDNRDLVRTAAGMGCYVGTLWYRGRFGAAALGPLLEEIGSPSFDETLIRGSFALVLCKDGRAWMLNDPLGFARVYSSSKFDFHCTSWLATRAFDGNPSINQAAAVEYVLLGAVHDDRTVAPGVSKLPLGCGIDVANGRTWKRFPRAMVEPEDQFDSMGAAVETVTPLLRGIFRDAASAFSTGISAALSGGFDSRLILAGLLDQGIRPRLFVYGGAESEDVPVAKAVARAEDLRLEVVDKAALDRSFPALDIDTAVRAALFFDGLPNDGILDRGADRRTRLAQSADGFLALNGGGGEIFRNFFHLPDRPLSTRDAVRAFYRAFDAAVFRRQGALRSYEERLGASMEHTLTLAGIETDTLQRRQHARASLELVYPFFRCHHWMGLNNSVAIRYGNFHTPLVELQTVRAAYRIPLEWKNAGQFQSRLIAALHFAVALHPSAYGFAFSDGPSRRMRVSEWLTRYRPVSIRPLVNAVRRAAQRVRASPETLAHCRMLLPGEWSIDASLDLSRLPDDAALARAFAIEIVVRHLSP